MAATTFRNLGRSLPRQAEGSGPLNERSGRAERRPGWHRRPRPRPRPARGPSAAALSAKRLRGAGFCRPPLQPHDPGLGPSSEMGLFKGGVKCSEVVWVAPGPNGWCFYGKRLGPRDRATAPGQEDSHRHAADRADRGPPAPRSVRPNPRPVATWSLSSRSLEVCFPEGADIGALRWSRGPQTSPREGFRQGSFFQSFSAQRGLCGGGKSWRPSRTAPHSRVSPCAHVVYVLVNACFSFSC